MFSCFGVFVPGFEAMLHDVKCQSHFSDNGLQENPLPNPQKFWVPDRSCKGFFVDKKHNGADQVVQKGPLTQSWANHRFPILAPFQVMGKSIFLTPRSTCFRLHDAVKWWLDTQCFIWSKQYCWRNFLQSFTGWWFEPLWKILVNWDDYSQYMGKHKMFQTTNQFNIPCFFNPKIPTFRLLPWGAPAMVKWSVYNPYGLPLRSHISVRPVGIFGYSTIYMCIYIYICMATLHIQYIHIDTCIL